MVLWIATQNFHSVQFSIQYLLCNKSNFTPSIVTILLDIHKVNMVIVSMIPKNMHVFVH